MTRVKFKGCARCGGDVVLEDYTGEDNESYCIQCSHRPLVPTEEKTEQMDDDAAARYAKFEELRELGRLRMDKTSVGN